MSEVLTMNETPADQPQFNADEQNSLEVAESISGEPQLLAGKFSDPQALEQAYLELQSKLGQPRNESETSEEGEQEEARQEKQRLTASPTQLDAVRPKASDRSELPKTK